MSDQEDLFARVTRAILDRVRKDILFPKFRNATVVRLPDSTDAFSLQKVAVHIDEDPQSQVTPAFNKSGLPLHLGQRVLMLFTPEGGCYVDSSLEPPRRPVEMYCDTPCGNDAQTAEVTFTVDDEVRGLIIILADDLDHWEIDGVTVSEPMLPAGVNTVYNFTAGEHTVTAVGSTTKDPNCLMLTVTIGGLNIEDDDCVVFGDEAQPEAFSFDIEMPTTAERPLTITDVGGASTTVAAPVDGTMIDLSMFGTFNAPTLGWHVTVQVNGSDVESVTFLFGGEAFTPTSSFLTGDLIGFTIEDNDTGTTIDEAIIRLTSSTSVDPGPDLQVSYVSN